MPEAIVAKLAKEVQENRPVDPIVAVYDLGRRLDHPERIVWVTGDMFQKRAFAVGAFPSLHEMISIFRIWTEGVPAERGDFLRPPSRARAHDGTYHFAAERDLCARQLIKMIHHWLGRG
jgi:hypothetical protein